MRSRLLIGINVDDMLKDWTKYSLAHGMELGVANQPGVHTYLVYAEGRECRVNLRSAAELDAEDALADYLADYLRRHPTAEIEFLEEEAIRARCTDEDHVGIMRG